jgi:hypothetical protein
MKKPRRAKAMDVYGRPPKAILARLSKRHVGELDRYIGRVANQVYRIAFDCGACDMVSQVMLAMNDIRQGKRR